MKELSLEKVIEWDVHNWKACLPFWTEGVDLKGKNVLALGERKGGLSLFFASQGAKVICSDFGGIHESVQEDHKNYPFANNISYKDINIFEIPYDDESFDIVVCKSVIGGLKLNPKEIASRTIENQRLALNEIQRVLKPGGFFFGAENMKGASIIQKIRNAYKKGNVGWRHLSVKDLKFLLTGFKDVHVTYFGIVPALLKSTFLNNLIYSFNVLANKITPPSSKYIAFIRCMK
jgi:ubiquinone/menaquinone biosynthesis C-methylase UbiE